MFSRLYNYATGRKNSEASLSHGSSTNGSPSSMKNVFQIATQEGSDAESSSGSPQSETFTPKFDVKKDTFPKKMKEKPVDDQALYEQFAQELDTNEDYEIVVDQPDILIKKKVVSTHTQHRVKARGIFEIKFENVDEEIHVLKDMLWDWSLRTSWDQILFNPETVLTFEEDEAQQKYNEEHKFARTELAPNCTESYGCDVVRYLCHSPIKWISEREFVQYRAFRFLKDECTYRLYFKSIEEPDLNEWLKYYANNNGCKANSEDLVRGKTLFSGYELRKIDEHTCCINFISQVDLQLGSRFVPAFVLNQAALKTAERWFKNFNVAAKHRLNALKNHLSISNSSISSLVEEIEIDEAELEALA